MDDVEQRVHIGRWSGLGIRRGALSYEGLDRLTSSASVAVAAAMAPLRGVPIGKRMYKCEVRREAEPVPGFDAFCNDWTHVEVDGQSPEWNRPAGLTMGQTDSGPATRSRAATSSSCARVSVRAA